MLLRHSPYAIQEHAPDGHRAAVDDDLALIVAAREHLSTNAFRLTLAGGVREVTPEVAQSAGARMSAGLKISSIRRIEALERIFKFWLQASAACLVHCCGRFLPRHHLGALPSTKIDSGSGGGGAVDFHERWTGRLCCCR